MLKDAALFLAAAVLFVPLFRRLGLGAVLGYLAAGMVIGPSGFGLIGEVDSVLRMSEFGVVLLLFLIGLELQPSRLWTLRRAVFGLGGAQVLVTGVLLAAIAFALGLSPAMALIAGFALAMSSTAFVLQMLAERKELPTRHGRAAFAVLLFQDLSAIPLLALIPLLAPQAIRAPGSGLHAAGALLALLVIVVGGRYALRPLLRVVARTEMPEIFTAAALLVVVATSFAMQAVGLSMSLGAFLAGVLLADSEYRHELSADIEPFKGLLLGLFFIAVGMSADLSLIFERPWALIGLVAGLVAIKTMVGYALGRANQLPADAARAFAVSLSQGGEFAFVLFGVAVSAGLMSHELQALLIMVVTLSMIATPPLYALQARLRREGVQRPYDTIVPTPDHQVVIAGFGPFGQIIARILRLKRVAFTVLDKDSEQVDFVRQFGSEVFYGDAARLDLLRAARADKARLFVLAIPDIEASAQVAENVRRHFPHLKIFAMAVNRQHALRLMDLGITDIIRRSFFSSLVMSEKLLLALGEPPEAAQRAIETFRRHDESTLHRQRAVYRDEQALIQTARDAAQELEQLFEADREQTAAERPAA